jgi:hypothetical protein
MKNASVAAILALWIAAGCGYHVSGHADALPRNIKTIAVPAFSNGTTRYQLGLLLPEDISREFVSRTRYAVVSDPKQADAVLRGAILGAVAYPITVDPTSARATVVEAVVVLQLTLYDRGTGKPIWNRPSASFRERYEISLDPSKYFEEGSTAMLRLSQDVARDVVSGVLEKF